MDGVSLAEPHSLGIDEAGRGPVLGSLVYGAVACPTRMLDDLTQLHFADSKTLTPCQREELHSLLINSPWIQTAVEQVSSMQLSALMQRKHKVSLNLISHDTTIRLIHTMIERGINIHSVHVDTVGDARIYQEKLSGLFPQLTFTVACKADSLYPIVSAASILAKVNRDKGMQIYRHREMSMIDTHIEMGSGYPADPVTVSWLSSHHDPVFGFPCIVRFSWSTAKKMMDNHCCELVWGDEESEGKKAAATTRVREADQPTMDRFMSVERRGDNKQLKERSKFFQYSRLQICETFNSKVDKQHK